MTVAKLLTAAVFATCLAGCAGQKPVDLSVVTTPAVGASEVEMLVGTTRQAAGEGTVFSGERSRTLAYANVVISIPPDTARKIGEVQRPERNPGNPDKEFVVRRIDRVDAPQAYSRFATLLAQPRNRGRALVFVHGYNNRFDDALLRFAQIVHDSKAPGVPVLFTWPSRGKLLAYPYDRESATYSREALANALERMSKDKRVTEISILAHSMGNWVAMEALRTLALKHGRVPPKIVNVMMASPDIDVDVFHSQLRSFGAKPPRMTLFVSRDDNALAASKRFAGDIPRLGAIDPTQEPYNKDFERAHIAVADLTKIAGDDAAKHDKFAGSPDIVRLIGLRLSDGQALHDPTENSGGLVSAALDAGASLGYVAGQALVAPGRAIGLISSRSSSALPDASSLR